MNSYELIQLSAGKMTAAADTLNSAFPDNKPPILSFETLRLMLYQAGYLYRGLNSELFDGKELTQPNLDTQLVFIQTMARATIYFARKSAMSTDLPRQQTEFIQEKSDLIFWQKFLEEYCGDKPQNIVNECAKVISDVYESVQAIAEELLISAGDFKLTNWNQIWRHLIHINEHIEYSETFIIDLMKI